jgi:serine protease Do
MNNDDSPMVFEDGDDTGWLGIEISEISADRAKELKLASDRGVEIVGVESDSPAGKAGLKEHDVITTFDGQTVEGRTQFRRLVRETPPGRTVSLGISRYGSVQTLTVMIGERKNGFQKKVKIFTSPDRVVIPSSTFAMPDFDFHFVAPEAMDMHTPLLGISAEDLSGQLGAYFGAPDGQGVLVREVRHGTPADKAGLKAGDVITKVDDTPVKSLHELRAHLREKTDQKSVNMSVLRKGSTISVPVEIEKPRPIDAPQVTHRAQF